MDQRVIDLLTQILQKQTVINFVAKWQVKIFFAVNVGGTWKYQVNDRFIPVSEVAFTDPLTRSYGLDHLDEVTATRVLHGSSAVNLLQAYNGINLDLSENVIAAGEFGNHFFPTQAEIAINAPTTGIVNDGDSVMVLVPQS